MDKMYLQSSYTGNVYKAMDNYILKLSPWKDDEDRRVYEYNNNDMQIITYKNACMIVNKQYSEIDEEWEYNGKQYKAKALTNKDLNEHFAMLKLLPSHYIKESVRTLRKLPDDNIITISDNSGNEFKMVKHQGKIGYILLINNQTNISRTKFYNTFGEFCKWVGIKDVKPIYCVDDKKYI